MAEEGVFAGGGGECESVVVEASALAAIFVVANSAWVQIVGGLRGWAGIWRGCDRKKRKW